MTVKELMELIADMPSDAIVVLKHELVGDEHTAEALEYNPRRNVVVIHETT